MIPGSLFSGEFSLGLMAQSRIRSAGKGFSNAFKSPSSASSNHLAWSSSSTLALIVLQALFCIFCPVWDQTPSQRIQASLLGFMIVPNGEDVLARSDVPTDRQVVLGRNRDMVTPR